MILDMPSCLYTQFFTRNPNLRSKIANFDSQTWNMRKNEMSKIMVFHCFSFFFMSNRRISLFLTSKSDSSWKTTYIHIWACLDSSNLMKKRQTTCFNIIFRFLFSSFFTSGGCFPSFLTSDSDSVCRNPPRAHLQTPRNLQNAKNI